MKVCSPPHLLKSTIPTHNSHGVKLTVCAAVNPTAQTALTEQCVEASLWEERTRWPWMVDSKKWPGDWMRQCWRGNSTRGQGRAKADTNKGRRQCFSCCCLKRKIIMWFFNIEFSWTNVINTRSRYQSFSLYLGLSQKKSAEVMNQEQSDWLSLILGHQCNTIQKWYTVLICKANYFPRDAFATTFLSRSPNIFCQISFLPL